jgi:hypothetical protein
MSNQKTASYLEATAIRLQEIAAKKDLPELIEEIKKIQSEQRYWCWVSFLQMPVFIRGSMNNTLIEKAILNAEVLGTTKK